METNAGRNQDRVTRDAGGGRPQYATPAGATRAEGQDANATRAEARGQNQKSSRLTCDDKPHNEVLRSITRLIAGCFRFFTMNHCFDRPA